jgi:predicted HAD superfamily Cof-like phosphohydrolase
MQQQFEMVKVFQLAMNQPVAVKPVAMDEVRQQQRYEYMAEELMEFIGSTELVDQADAMIDLIYLAIGTLVELGVQPEPLFQIVQNANMSKLWEDGKPRLNPETNKVMKPSTFVRPEPLLQAEIERQIADAEKVNA